MNSFQNGFSAFSKKALIVLSSIAMVAVMMVVTVCTPPAIDDNGDGTNNTSGDIIKPSVGFTAPVTTPIAITTNGYLFTGVASDNVAIEGVYFSRNGSAFNKISSTITWSTNVSDLAEGTNTIEVYAKDVAGNQSATASRLIIVDTGAPTVTVTPSGDITTNQSFTAVLSVNENYGYWSTNGSAYTEFLYGTPENILIDNNTTLEFYGYDGYGVTSATQTVVYQIIPDVSITAGPTNNITTNEAFLVTLTATENYGYFSTNSSIFAQFPKGNINIWISNNTTLKFYASIDGVNTSSTQTVVYTMAIDLSVSNASTATNIQFFAAVNTYSFPFYVAGIIRAEPDFTLPLTNDGVPMSPLGCDENVLIETMDAGAVVIAGLVDWGVSAGNSTEYKFQGDPTTEVWSYDAVNGYKFVVNKSRFNYGVDSLVFCSTYKPAAWGGPGSGTGQNAIPQQASMGIGNKIFDIAVTNLDLGITPDASIKWVATNSGANSITMIGIKNDKVTFDLYLKGSVVSSNVMADLTGASSCSDIWAQFMVVFGKQ